MGLTLIPRKSDFYDEISLVPFVPEGQSIGFAALYGDVAGIIDIQGVEVAPVGIHVQEIAPFATGTLALPLHPKEGVAHEPSQRPFAQSGLDKLFEPSVTEYILLGFEIGVTGQPHEGREE